MKLLLRIYSASCIVIVGFLLFFMIPFEALPFSGEVTAIAAGALILSVAGAYVLRLHSREGFEFGWFLANKAGFWVIVISFFGLLLVLSGILIFAAPEAVKPAFERGVWPVAGILVLLFWLALIFMFAFLSVTAFDRTAAFVRLHRFKDVLGALLLAALCTAMAGVFFSLFLEVVNDVFFRIPEQAQWIAIFIFTAAIVLAGSVHGSLAKISGYLDTEDLATEALNPENDRSGVT